MPKKPEFVRKSSSSSNLPSTDLLPKDANSIMGHQIDRGLTQQDRRVLQMYKTQVLITEARMRLALARKNATQAMNTSLTQAFKDALVDIEAIGAEAKKDLSEEYYTYFLKFAYERLEKNGGDLEAFNKDFIIMLERETNTPLDPGPDPKPASVWEQLFGRSR